MVKVLNDNLTYSTMGFQWRKIDDRRYDLQESERLRTGPCGNWESTVQSCRGTSQKGHSNTEVGNDTFTERPSKALKVGTRAEWR